MLIYHFSKLTTFWGRDIVILKVLLHKWLMKSNLIKIKVGSQNSVFMLLKIFDYGYPRYSICFSAITYWKNFWILRKRINDLLIVFKSCEESPSKRPLTINVILRIKNVARVVVCLCQCFHIIESNSFFNRKNSKNI